MTPTVWEDASQWQIHLRREAWPQRAGFRFIVAAFDDVLNTLWGLQTEDVIGEFEQSGGLRNAAADFFHSALMTGAFVARAQPSKGGATRSILSTDWVPETVDRALATGRIERKLNGRRDDMWVYIDDAELGLMRKVLSVTEPLRPDMRVYRRLLRFMNSTASSPTSMWPGCSFRTIAAAASRNQVRGPLMMRPF